MPELLTELLERVEPAVRELGTEALLSALNPVRCEGDRQLEIGARAGLEAVAADLAERSLRRLVADADGNDPGERHPLRAMRATGWPARCAARRASRRRTRT